jgi:hypothetical protein
VVLCIIKLTAVSVLLLLLHHVLSSVCCWQCTVNNQIVVGTLMNICDNPNQVSTQELQGLEIGTNSKPWKKPILMNICDNPNQVSTHELQGLEFGTTNSKTGRNLYS